MSTMHKHFELNGAGKKNLWISQVDKNLPRSMNTLGEFGATLDWKGLLSWLSGLGKVKDENTL